MDILAKRIKYLRKKKHMTQVRLANELYLTQETISSYEKAKIIPSSDILIKLADVLYISTDYLLGRTDNMLPISFADKYSLEENKIIFQFRLLSSWKQQRLLGFLEGLLENI